VVELRGLLRGFLLCFVVVSVLVLFVVDVPVCVFSVAAVDEAASVKRQLDKWESMGFVVCVELNKRRSREAADLALRLRLRGWTR
jgi:hypothetical protein